jgi:hypothetical protein
LSKKKGFSVHLLKNLFSEFTIRLNSTTKKQKLTFLFVDKQQRSKTSTKQNKTKPLHFTSFIVLCLSNTTSSSMAKLRTAIDSSFWDLNISSPQNLDGWAKAVPGDPFPLDASVSSRIFRHQQLSEQLSPRFGIIPSFAPSSVKEVGSFSLQSLLLNLTTNRW